MIASLPLYHSITGQPVIVLGNGEAAEAKRRLVERAGGVVVDESNDAARLAFVALDEPEEAAAQLKARGVLVNVPDRPSLCDFTVPSILDRSPVLLAIGTGGASAGLAKALRLRLELILPQSLGDLAGALSKARSQLRARLPDAGERRHALDAALGAGGCLDTLRDGSAALVAGWLDGEVASAVDGIAEIWLTSADPDDLTLRHARLLGTADVIAHEADVPAAILDRARADALRLCLPNGQWPEPMTGLVVILRSCL